jgi:hypothetical protein
LSSLRRLTLLVGRRGGWFIRAFSPFAACEATGSARSSAEPNCDPTPAEGGYVGRQGCDIDGPIGTPVSGPELGRHHRPQACGITKGGTDHLVTGIGRRLVLYRTDVLIRRNPARAPPSYDHTETPPPVSKEDQHERDLFYA